MTTIIPAQFWPGYLIPKPGMTMFQYPAVGDSPAYFSEFSYDKTHNCMLLKQYDAAHVWMNTWYIQYKNGFGLAEFRDDLPGPITKVENYSVPIGWGNTTETVPGQYANQPSFDTLACFPPQFGSGFQAIAWEKLLPTFKLSNGKTYKNVLQMLYQQSWNNGMAKGARMWMANQFDNDVGGPIATQWVVGSVETPRQDATVIVS